ncbi:MAG: helix-turn-helix domain-containing protein [Oscillospiraceae bacterium]|nr:helix-turn-helix domain-containing protein [Oscillospiraceae bacterium]
MNSDGADNSGSVTRLRENMRRAIGEELTDRQKARLDRYSAGGMNMTQIAGELRVNRSTVSRTIKRGQNRLWKCVRYGAMDVLNGR